MKSAMLILSLLVLVGCQTQSEPFKFSGGDGSTRESAVVIKAPDMGIGVAAQMIWMKKRYAGWREITNEFESVDGKFYQSVVVAREGETNRVYFDCTDFVPKSEKDERGRMISK